MCLVSKMSYTWLRNQIILFVIIEVVNFLLLSVSRFINTFLHLKIKNILIFDLPILLSVYFLQGQPRDSCKLAFYQTSICVSMSLYLKYFTYSKLLLHFTMWYLCDHIFELHLMAFARDLAKSYSSVGSRR